MPYEPMPNQLTLPFEPEHSDGRPEILVIGDRLEDHWHECDSMAISAEAPVPVVKSNKQIVFKPGGAANVAENLSAMGWKVYGIYQPGDYRRPIKSRFLFQGRQVFRVDFNDRIQKPIKQSILIEGLGKAVAFGLPVVIADYNKGAIDTQALKIIRDAISSTKLSFYIHTKHKPDVYAEKKGPLFFYNQKECEAIHRPGNYRAIVTLGARGAAEVALDYRYSVNSPIPGSVRSTCGAGDVFMAAYITAIERYRHSNPLAIADAIAKKTVCECSYTCVYQGGF